MRWIIAGLFITGLNSSIFAQQTADCKGASSTAYLNINNIKAYVSNGGNFWGHSLHNPGYQVNGKDTVAPQTHTIFTSALWLGAIDEAGGTLKVAAVTYRQSGNDFWPGPINDESQTTNFEQCYNYNRHWKLNRETVEKFSVGAHLTKNEKENIYEWPGKGNPHLYFKHLNQPMAPFYDVDGDNVYNPDKGDYPKIKGDQAVWWIINDVGNKHSETAGEPLGVELKKMAYAFNSDQKLKNSTFLEVQITNKTNNNYKDFLFGCFVDFDLGNYVDDFVGCDTTNAIGYAYNGDDFDDSAEGFGYEIPIQGCQFLDVPSGYYGTENKMYAFVYYNSDFSDISNPTTTEHYYTYLQGIWKNGLPITYGGNGTNTSNKISPYMYSGNPSNPDAWSECSVGNEPADRRIIMSSGKYKFASGETKTWTLGAHTIPNVGGTCPNVQPLIDQAKYAKIFFDRFLVTDIEDNFVTTNASVYPNPVHHKLYFNTPIPTKKIEVFSLSGELILQKNINSNYLNIDALSKGLYYAKLFGKDGKTYRAKFVKK